MPEYKLPKKLSIRQWYIIRELGNYQLKNPKGPGITTAKLRSLVPLEYASEVTKDIGNSYRSHPDWFSRKEEEGARLLYRLSKLGMAIHENLDNIRKVEMEKLQNRKGKTKSKSQEAPTPGLNLSTDANVLADNIAGVFKQIHDYRQLLVQVHSLIGHALELHGEDNGERHETGS